MFRGVAGALMDLEFQRIELIKFNLFDNNGTWRSYVTGVNGTGGPAIKTWPEMRLPKDNPNYPALMVDGDGQQICKGDLIRARTVTGICNDILNPLMGSTGTPVRAQCGVRDVVPGSWADGTDAQPPRRTGWVC